MFKYSPRTAAIATALLVGGGGYAAFEIMETPKVIETPAQVEACAGYLDTAAKYLGTTSISSKDLAGPCKEVPGLLDKREVYSQKASENESTLVDTVFLLPVGDGDEFQSRSRNIISEHKEQRQDDDNFRKIFCFAGGVIAGATIYFVDRRDQKRQRIKKIEARFK